MHTQKSHNIFNVWTSKKEPLISNVSKVFLQVLIREQFYPGREFSKSNVWGQTTGSWEVRVGHTLRSPASWTGVRVWLVYSWKLILSIHPVSTESEYLGLGPSNYILTSSAGGSSACSNWRPTAVEDWYTGFEGSVFQAVQGPKGQEAMQRPF